MRMNDSDTKVRGFLGTLQRYIVFFVIVSFVVTCCMMLFLQSMSSVMGITFDADNIGQAAKLTMGNVVLLSLLLASIDWVRRKIMIDRPVKRITDAAGKIMEGDFTVRIKPFHEVSGMEGFNTIIHYFNRMAEELSGTETLRTDFIANVSHELKTPLAILQNYATMLQQPGLSEEKRMEYAKAVSEASRRQANLITNILKLNKLENQQIFPMNETYDLGEQLCECLLGFERAWEKKELEIETDLEEAVMVSSDKEMLTLVWNNLFSNAIKFTPHGGKVSLSLKTEGNHAIVSVADTGCGISNEVGQHIFEKFYQGDTSHATQGNGLGLALVKRVVDIIGGEISVESELGRGSVFTVKLERGQLEGEMEP